METLVALSEVWFVVTSRTGYRKTGDREEAEAPRACFFAVTVSGFRSSVSRITGSYERVEKQNDGDITDNATVGGLQRRPTESPYERLENKKSRNAKNGGR